MFLLAIDFTLSFGSPCRCRFPPLSPAHDAQFSLIQGQSIAKAWKLFVIQPTEIHFVLARVSLASRRSCLCISPYLGQTLSCLSYSPADSKRISAASSPPLPSLSSQIIYVRLRDRPVLSPRSCPPSSRRRSLLLNKLFNFSFEFASSKVLK